MVVQHNLTAMNANRMLGITTKNLSKSTEKLSSGYKINRAADDAAGLSISEKMRKQIRGLSQASLNAEDGISTVQTAEGALTEVHDMLQRLNELAVKAANETNSENDRQYIQSEVDQLVTEIDRVSTATKFNEIYLLKGKNKDGKAGSLSYTTAKTNLEANFFKAQTLDKATGTATISSDKQDKQTSGFDNTNYTGYKFETQKGTYILVENTSPADATKEHGSTLDAIKGLNKTANQKAFSSMDDLVAAILKDSNGSGDIRSIDVGQTATGAPTLKINTFADLNNGMDISLHVGADSSDDNKIKMNINMMSARGLGINGLRVDGLTDKNATKAIDVIAAAVQKVSTQRSSLGAIQNRLEHTIKNLDNIVENTTAAESQIRDTNMATEMVKYSNNNVLAQAGQSMLAQANQSKQGILSLLG